MKVEVEKNEIVLKEVFNPIVFKGEDKEKLSICVRDKGFEIKYDKSLIVLNGGKIEARRVD